MTYSIRYTSEAVRDMDAVCDGVYEASKGLDIADRYVIEFADAIAEKKLFRSRGYRSSTAVCSLAFIQ